MFSNFSEVLGAFVVLISRFVQLDNCLSQNTAIPLVV